MSVNRNGFGIGVLDGVMYAIGGINGTVVHKSVEIYRPSTGVWTPIANMHLSRHDPGSCLKKIRFKKYINIKF